MKKLLLILLCFISLNTLTYASFPIKYDFQKSDTIIQNDVDSLSNYPIQKETLAQYKERLKKHMNINSNTSKREAIWKNFMDNNSNLSSKSNTIDWITLTFKVIIGLLIGFLIFIIILLASSGGSFGV